MKCASNVQSKNKNNTQQTIGDMGWHIRDAENNKIKI